MRKTIFVLLVAFLVVPNIQAGPIFLGPTEYRAFDDSVFVGETRISPFAGMDFSSGYFHLEDFEGDLSFNTVGVSDAPGAPNSGIGSVTGSPLTVDSVDGDDGAIDGSGSNGESYFAFSGATGITFTFDANVLGALPTHVGIVWTDGLGTITFEAFGVGGAPLGDMIGAHADGQISGETAEDRFYGVIDPDGISSINIRNSDGGIEVDHLQFGLIPEPSTVVVTSIGLLGLAMRRRVALTIAHLDNEPAPHPHRILVMGPPHRCAADIEVRRTC